MSELGTISSSPSFAKSVVVMTSNNGGYSCAGASAEDPAEDFVWTPWTVTQTILIFLVTGVFEIGGGWMVWQAVRGDNNRPWWWALVGSLVMVGYAFLPTLQRADDSFGRIYAIYGGFFIVGSFLAGWMLDGDRPDKGDWIGGGITLVGVLLILFWPRADAADNG